MSKHDLKMLLGLLIIGVGGGLVGAFFTPLQTVGIILFVVGWGVWLDEKMECLSKK